MSAAIIQSLTGFGFGLVSVPFLLFLFPSRQAVLMSMVLSLCSLLLQGVRSRELANWVFLRRLILIGLPGLIAGLLLGDILNPVLLKGVVGVTLIIYVSFQWVLAEKKTALAFHPGVKDTDIDSVNVGDVGIRDVETKKPTQIRAVTASLLLIVGFTSSWDAVKALVR